jgi:hypothetical protein
VYDAFPIAYDLRFDYSGCDHHIDEYAVVLLPTTIEFVATFYGTNDTKEWCFALEFGMFDARIHTGFIEGVVEVKSCGITTEK